MRRWIALVVAALPFLPSAEAQTQAVPQSRELVRLSYAPVVKKAAPAVVNVFSRRVVRTQSPFANDPIFRRFFGEGNGFGMPIERVQRSLGSGVILDPRGFIVTNHHVIKDASEVTVVLSDRREFEAKILLSDEHSDLAVLKIETGSERLPVLEVGDSDALDVGDVVLAIGNPFGVGQTVTSGIVSGLARTGLGISDFRSFIQTDAAINPGNSGGALVDLDGRLVGINTAIFSQSGGSNGIGFATPAALVRPILEAAVRGGRITHPWFGASGQGVTAEIAQSLGLERPGGVLVKDVVPGSPAAAAGVRMGDVILEVGGHEVEDVEGLRFRIATLPLRAVELTLWRDGKTRSASTTLVKPPEAPPRDTTELNGVWPLAGAVVANLNPALTDELGFDPTEHGVVVTEVRDGTPAARLGLEPGDILASLNRRQVASVREIGDIVRTVAGPWTVQVRRGKQLLTVVVR